MTARSRIHGLPFGKEMVLAHLFGWKTATRRLVRPQPEPCTLKLVQAELFKDEVPTQGWSWRGQQYTEAELRTVLVEHCPYGQPGDVLYGKETWKPVDWTEDAETWSIQYRADREVLNGVVLFPEDERNEHFFERVCKVLHARGVEEAYVAGYTLEHISEHMPWRPGRFMPKGAARLWMLITELKACPLQEITEEEAIAEGMPGLPEMGPSPHRREFIALWDDLHGPGAWAANPWVYAPGYRVLSIKGRPHNLDAILSESQKLMEV